MNDINSVIDTLNDEELDLLNSDPEMLAAFKKKYSTPAASPQKSAMSQAMEYPSKTPPIATSWPGVASQLTRFVNPFPESPTTNPVAMLEGKRQFLEGASKKVKEAKTSAIGNQVENGMNPYAAAAFDTAFDLAPFAPSEFAPIAAGAIGGPSVSVGTRGIQSEIANRNLQAPKLIRESRYVKGQSPVGEIALDTDPKVAKLAVSNKDAIYKRSNSAIENLGNKIRLKIAEIFEGGRTPNAPEVNVPGGQRRLEYKPSTVEARESAATQPRYSGMLSSGESAGLKGDVADLSDKVATVQPGGARYDTAVGRSGPHVDYSGTTRTPNVAPKRPLKALGEGYSRMAAPVEHNSGIRTREIADAVNPVLDRVGRSAGVDSQIYRDLIDLRNRFIQDNGPVMDFMTANNERMRLGDEVGRAFNKDTSLLPELTEAQRAMWSKLRDKIGNVSPELDKMLRTQHDLIDVRTSALPNAALGYTKTPDTMVGMAKAPLRSMGIADFLANTLTRTSGLGATAGAGARHGVVDNLEKLMSKKGKDNGRK